MHPNSPQLSKAVPQHRSSLFSFCVLCRRTKKADEKHRDICTGCEAAIDHIRVARDEGPCPVCQQHGTLFTSDFYSADHRWCHRHAVTATLRHIEGDVTEHAGDVRNVA